MSATGIGASVKRKEDIRFITGKGHYVDDINRPGQAYAYFLRSPHAHATIDKIDASAALKAPGVVAVLTGDDVAADKVGGLICGWMIHSKDGSPMKAGAHPALAQGKVRYVGDHVAVVIADTYAQARDAAEKIVVDYGELPAAVDPATATKPGQPQIHDVAPNNTVFNWHLGDKAATDAAFASAKHVTKLDLVNNRTDPERDGAARGDRRLRLGNGYDHALHDQPEPASRAARPVGVHRASRPSTSCASSRRTSAAASARRSSSTPRRPSAPGRPRRSTGRSNGRRNAPNRSCGRARPRSRLARRTGARRERQDVRACACIRSPISAPICRPSHRRSRLISTRRCCRASTTSRRSTARSTRSTPTPRRSTPFAAPAGRRRPSSSSAWSRSRRARPDATPAEFRRMNFVTSFPHQTPVVLDLRRRRLCEGARQGAGTRRLQGRGRAQGGLGRQGQAARRRHFRLYRGLRPRAVAAVAVARRWRRPVGIGGGARQSGRHGRGSDRLAQPRPGSRDDLRPARLRTASASRSTTSRSSMATPTRCSSAWAPTARAPARSACRRLSKALDKIEAKAKKVAGHVLEASEQDIEFKDGKFTVKGTDKSIDFGSVALNAYIAHKFNGQELEPGLKEGAFWDPTNFTFPAGVHICELEIDPETGRRDDRPLDRGRRLRQAHQSDDRRGPGARRRRARHRPGAARRRALRRATGSC